MKMYFIEASYTNNVYKVSDFYVGNYYKLDPDYMLELNLKANDGATRVIGVPSFINSKNINTFTHIIVPSENKIYQIYNINYLNHTQVDLELMEDVFIGHYQGVRGKKIQLARSNDTRHFIGIHDIKDVAIKHTATINAETTPYNNIGPMILLTYQMDTPVPELEFGDIKNYPSLGIFDTLDDVIEDYPEVESIASGYEVDYYLMFAELQDGRLYQCVYTNAMVEWVQVEKNVNYEVGYSSINKESVKLSRYKQDVWISNIGDIATRNILLPLESTLVTEIEVRFDNGEPTGNGKVYIPSFYHLKEIPPNGLMSVKVVPSDIVDLKLELENSNQIVNFFEMEVSIPEVQNHYYAGNRYVKTITSDYVDISATYTDSAVWINRNRLPMIIAKSFKDIFTFDYSFDVSSILDYEPFKKYYIYFYGEVVEIPARYLTVPINFRLAITSTDVLYECYTDKMNIIASGRLMWFTRYAVDQLAQFEANNPTYKEQFWTQSILNGLKTGLMGGLLGGGITAVGGAGFSLASGIANHLYMQKGLRDVADQIYGQNDVSLTMLKGFNTFLVTVMPETNANDMMEDTLELIGFPTDKVTTIDALNYSTNTIYPPMIKLVSGELIEKVLNPYVSRAIAAQLSKGVILIP